ncbi:MAG: phosphoribosylanthranilate isomerase [Desulfobulbaceae bacterium]|nr:phosphoribosylanthranilate isomerase [Desulfobulbaceae bacterium]
MNEPARIRVKICGMTRLEDALCAVEAGVDALGFIFYAKSPRSIEPEAAQRIIAQLPPFVDAVGVFVDRELSQVAAIIKQCRLGYAQLHGTESPEDCRQLAQLAAPCQVLKAVRVGPQSTAADVALYRDSVQGFLLDTYQKNAVGGTGTTFDWSLIDSLKLTKPFLLAGGLDVGNIRTALEHVRPYGVDANSGLEIAPGRKDHSLIRQFVVAVRQFEADRLSGQK